MKTSETSVEPQGVASDEVGTVFRIAAKSGVWTVTRNGRFYGDYLKEEHALESARCAAAAILAGGGVAAVRVSSTSAPGQVGPLDPIDVEAIACERPSRYPVRGSVDELPKA